MLLNLKKRVKINMQKSQLMNSDIKLCLKSVIFWMIICHGFGILKQLISFDSMLEFDASLYGNLWKVRLGRVIVPFYRAITRGDLTSTWIIGILSSFYIGLSLYLIMKIFKIESKRIIFLIAGILVANITLITQIATFINDLDCNMFALLMAILAVYLWNKGNKKLIIALVCVSISIGIYQSYISVTIVLIVMKLMIEILEERELRKIWFKGLKGIVILLTGGVLYFFLMKGIQKLFNVSVFSNGYNSVDKFVGMSFSDYLTQTYYAYVGGILNLYDSLKRYSSKTSFLIHLWIFIYLLPFIILYVKDKKYSIKRKILFIGLGLLIPFGMNIAQILTKGDASHALMWYAFIFNYIFLLILIEKNYVNSIKIRYFKLISVIGIIVYLYTNIITANEIYLKKYYEQDATIGVLSRVLKDLEKEKDYIPGETKVAFIGNINYLFHSPINFGRYIDLFGVANNNMCLYGYYGSFFRYILNYPIRVVADEEQASFLKMEEVKNMESYPKEKSIKKINEVFVVKFEVK